MSSSDTSKKPLAVDFNEDRLRAWREKRAKIAAASRQERARLADAEKTDRGRVLQEEKDERLRLAAEQRATEEASKKVERLQAARIRLAGRADVDAARQRLLTYRTKAARKLSVRLATWVGVPTFLIAVYLFTIATPLFEANAKFAIRAENAVATTQANSGLLSPPAGHQDAAQIRAFILSPQMMQELDRKDGFFAHLGSGDVDPITRLKPIPALQLTELDQFKRAVRVQINSQEGIINLSTTARDPKTAVTFATTILEATNSYLNAELSAGLNIRMISAPVSADIAAYPRRLPSIALAFLAFLSCFALVSIFGATLRRHGQI